MSLVRSIVRNHLRHSLVVFGQHKVLLMFLVREREECRKGGDICSVSSCVLCCLRKIFCDGIMEDKVVWECSMHATDDENCVLLITVQRAAPH